jgi:hypothetical protein
MFLVFQGYNSCALKIAISKGYEEPHKNTKDAWFSSQFRCPNFTMQKEDSPSHQNTGKCMEY